MKPFRSKAHLMFLHAKLFKKSVLPLIWRKKDEVLKASLDYTVAPNLPGLQMSLLWKEKNNTPSTNMENCLWVWRILNTGMFRHSWCYQRLWENQNCGYRTVIPVTWESAKELKVQWQLSWKNDYEVSQRYVTRNVYLKNQMIETRNVSKWDTSVFL